MANFLKPFVNWVAKNYGDNIGKMLIHTGVIGWILSSAAQVVAIMINDKIPKKQKMYMIPQEIADAGVNIISFYLITQTFKGLGSKLVDTGRWLSGPVRKFLLDNNIQNVGKKGFDVLTQGHLTPEMMTKFKDFRSGMDVIFTTIGTVLSCNIVTPIVRNEIAANRQKKSIKTMEEPYNVVSNQSIFTQNPYMKRPTMDSFTGNSYARTSVYPNSSSLKI
ncbi:hypothetical protein J6A34_04580 [bacterium]|nr:hypothetical protein [bacterium]